MVTGPDVPRRTIGTADLRTPDHYRGRGDLQPFDVIDAFGLDFWLGNVTKFVCRAGHKPGTAKIEDLVKARRYLDEAIAREQALPPTGGTLVGSGGGSGGSGGPYGTRSSALTVTAGGGASSAPGSGSGPGGATGGPGTTYQ